MLATAWLASYWQFKSRSLLMMFLSLFFQRAATATDDEKSNSSRRRRRSGAGDKRQSTVIPKGSHVSSKTGLWRTIVFITRSCENNARAARVCVCVCAPSFELFFAAVSNFRCNKNLVCCYSHLLFMFKKRCLSQYYCPIQLLIPRKTEHLNLAL